MTDILEFFPYDQPRPGQLKMLRWIERNWNNFDIMVPQVPVAGGKSGLSVTVANWANHVHGMSVGITTPDNVLVAQYKKDFNLPTLPKKSQFLGSDYFHAAREEFKNEPIKLMNNYTLLANRAYSNVQCMDECFMGDMEILTSEGWKRFDSLNKTEKVAQVDKDTLELTYCQPTRYIIKDVTDHNMLNVKTKKGMNVTATENHDFLIEHSDGTRHKKPIKDVSFSTCKIFKAAKASGIKDYISPEDKFKIMFQADGYFNGFNNVYFTFSKQRKIDEFIQLMGEGSFKYKEIKGHTRRGNIKARRRFSVQVDFMVSKNLWDVFTISDYSSNWCNQALDYMVIWDGHIQGNSYYYSSAVEENVDFYQAIAVMAGHAANKSKQKDNRSETYSDIHRLYITIGKTSLNRPAVEKQEFKYTGKVYCVTVPKGNIVIRKNGKPLVVGNCHELIPMLQDFEGIKIWKHLDYYPDDLRTVADILMWAASLGPSSDLGKKVIKQLSKNPLDYTIVHEKAAYRGKERDCLRIYPLTPKNNKPILWPPSKVQKLILMSATIAGPDIEDLGLHNRRVGYLEVPSDIPAANRPVIFEGVAKMGRFRKESDIDKCAEFIKKKEQEHGTRGFVHATYELARDLKKRYPKDFIYHDSVDKTRKLNSWLNNKQNTKTFVGCGLTTGLDLKGDICRWQVILKVQYPDLGDPAVMAKANNNPKWYYWSTVKQLLQAYGRICRTPDDTGTTYVIDSDFILLYNKHRDLFSQWFKDAFTF